MKHPTLISWNFATESTLSSEVIDVHFKNEYHDWLVAHFHVDYDERITLRGVSKYDDLIDEEIAAEVIDDLRRYNSYGYAKTEHYKERP